MTTANVQALVVAGGGGGGGDSGGGGGGGGVIYNSAFSITTTSYTITVGTGGRFGRASPAQTPQSGGNSVFSSLTAVGGGYGGWYNMNAPAVGGSGGGGGTKNQAGAAGTSGQGFAGGKSYASEYDMAGGGGAAGVGIDGKAHKGGDGGPGLLCGIDGTQKYYGGGGGGGSHNSEAGFGYGGSGVGGNGQGSGTAATNGAANTGGGGGGAFGGGGGGLGGAGADGVVVISYPTGSLTATGGTITTVGPNTVHTFTTGGTWTVSAINSSLSTTGPWTVDGKSYPYSKKITTTNPTDGLVGYPLPVKFTADTDIGVHCNADLSDIRFTDIYGNLLYHEYVSGSASGGSATGFFYVQTTLNTSSNIIWIYYGVPSQAAMSAANQKLTWDSAHIVVYHLNETGTNPTAVDSKGNYNTTTNLWTPTTGKLGGGAQFDGTAQYLKNAMPDTGMTAFTYHAWVKATATPNAYSAIIAKNETSVTTRYAALLIKDTHKLAPYILTAGGSVNYDGSGSNTFDTTSWYHVVMTYEPSGGLCVYVNGTLDHAAVAGLGAANLGATYFEIGSYEPDYTNRRFTGIIDEVRISNVPRSAACVAYDYTVQNSATCGLTWGAEQSGPITTICVGLCTSKGSSAERVIVSALSAGAGKGKAVDTCVSLGSVLSAGNATGKAVPESTAIRGVLSAGTGIAKGNSAADTIWSVVSSGNATGKAVAASSIFRGILATGGATGKGTADSETLRGILSASLASGKGSSLSVLLLGTTTATMAGGKVVTASALARNILSGGSVIGKGLPSGDVLHDLLAAGIGIGSGTTGSITNMGITAAGIVIGKGKPAVIFGISLLGLPILNKIGSAIADLIAGMRIADGFNFDWGIVNEQDVTIGDFPRCVINPTDKFADDEMSQDLTGGIGSGEYTNGVVYTLLTKGELPQFDSNPLFAIRSTLRKAQDDLKMLFGIRRSLDGTADNIMYVGSQIEPLRRNDGQRPAQLRTFWKVLYAQERNEPAQYAGK